MSRRNNTPITKLEFKPEFRLVRINETYGYQHWLDQNEVKLSAIWGYYLYDAKLAVHCCELTPSYELTPLFPSYTGLESVGPQVAATFSPGGDPQDMYDWIEQALAACQESDVSYVHCSDIDSMPSVLLLDTATGQSDSGWECDDIDPDDLPGLIPAEIAERLAEFLCERRARGDWEGFDNDFSKALGGDADEKTD